MMLVDRVLARVSAWRRVKRIGGAWWHVILTPRLVAAHERSDEGDFSQKSRSKRLLSDGAICGLIGEAKVVAVARQWSLMYWSHNGGNGAAHNNGYSG